MLYNVLWRWPTWIANPNKNEALIRDYPMTVYVQLGFNQVSILLEIL
jgi:hypothetical protein